MRLHEWMEPPGASTETNRQCCPPWQPQNQEQCIPRHTPRGGFHQVEHVPSESVDVTDIPQLPAETTTTSGGNALTLNVNVKWGCKVYEVTTTCPKSTKQLWFDVIEFSVFKNSIIISTPQLLLWIECSSTDGYVSKVINSWNQGEWGRTDCRMKIGSEESDRKVGFEDL